MLLIGSLFICNPVKLTWAYLVKLQNMVTMWTVWGHNVVINCPSSIIGLVTKWDIYGAVVVPGL